MPLRKLTVVALGFFASTGNAQLFLSDLADSDLGRSPRAQFISFLGIVAPGKMATDPSSRPAGRLAEVTVEEMRATGDVAYSIRTRYDEQSRPVEEVRTEQGSQTTTITQYQNSHVVAAESAFSVPPGRAPQPRAWNYWTYDADGKLTDFRRGRGDTLENHYSNFQHDNQGRLTSFEYRQGAKDELQNRTAFEYSPGGDTVTEKEYDATGGMLHSISSVIDSKGRVSQVTIIERDWKTKMPGPALRVVFTYDARGRLIEQATDPYEPERSGIEQALPPGKVSLVYDDAKHTRTSSYSDKDGSVTSTTVLDSSGATIAQMLETVGTAYDMKLECTFDDHDNWTACQRLVSAGGSSKVTGTWRRTIKYR